MPISLVTYRKGGTGEAMIAATRKLKLALEKYGAESIVISQVIAGPDAGQWSIVIEFANWDAFGKAMQAGLHDPAALEARAGLDAVAECVSRRLVAGVDL
ncbi:MAG: hypothetical protein ABSC06_23410 [Rhodopila sp.]|jgi:hypothetical protein